MRDEINWKPTKFFIDRNGLTPNPRHVSVRSRLICQIYAPLYTTYIRNHAKGVLLDCGSGHVPFYALYRDLVSQVFCVDWLNTRHENKFLDCVADLNRGLPFKNSSFDTILLTDVLEHIAYPGRLFAEVSRLLRPNGVVLIMVPFYYRIHESPHDYFRYTKFALQMFCDDSGLEVLSLEAYGGFWDVVFDLTNKKLCTREWRVRLLLTFYQWVSNTDIYRRIRAKSSESYPLGYCLAARKRSS